MKATIILITTLFFVQIADAQTRKVREKDLDGIWQMKITLDENFLEEDIEAEDNAFARVILQATGNFVEGVLDEIDVKFEFQPNGKCKVYATAFGEEGDVDYSKWWITDKGELFIDDTESYKSDEDDYFLFEDDVLVLRDQNGEIDDDARVVLVRID